LKRIFTAACCLLLLTCASARDRRRAAPVHPPVFHEGVFAEEGVASWYGKEYHGLPTSSGELFDMHALTAAHRSLPFGTQAEVFCPSTGRTVVVRINDRGPFIPGRIIDLSYAAAADLGIAMAGIARVRIRAGGLASAPLSSREAEKLPKRLLVQVGAFKDPGNAARLRARLLGEFPSVTVVPYGAFSRVLIGPLADEGEAARAADKARELGLPSIIRCE
jgi:rare lipoprotein A